MQYSIGQAVRTINKKGLNPMYFLLGADSFLQNFLIKNIKHQLGNGCITKSLDFSDKSDVDLTFNHLNSISMFSSKNIFIIRNFNNLSKNNQLFMHTYLQNSLVLMAAQYNQWVSPQSFYKVELLLGDHMNH